MPNNSHIHSIAKRIQHLREEHGFTKAGLARQIGVSDVSVNYWESGETKAINHTNLIVLARIFGITVSELLEDPMLTEHDDQVAAQERERCARYCAQAEISTAPSELAKQLRQLE